ncbi:hypothetical protein [Vibrio mediterranei]|uniref:hypothetical protein n=1 Tax=Vibrio mediterranei TaxID=689 RepID=UPI002283DC44|nr:hypothetical protein [Vibrio mediterranei]MCY9855819.1 hypothetical protein [Vibrio mediterranei]
MKFKDVIRKKPTSTLKFVAIEKLKAQLEAALGIETVIEPSNAMARKEIRIMASPKGGLTRLPMSGLKDAVPYEMMLDVVVSMRLSGGNTSHFLTAQAMEASSALGLHLGHESVSIENVAQAITLPKLGELSVVGDAELTDAKQINVLWSGSQDSEEFETSDELFVYREDWQMSLLLTIHRRFDNPLLKHVTLRNTQTQEEIHVDGQ